jgi:hypothetical protein
MSRRVRQVEIVEAKARNGKRYNTFQNKRKRSPVAPIKRGQAPHISRSKEELNDFNNGFNDQGPDVEPSIRNKKAKTKKASGRVMFLIPF